MNMLLLNILLAVMWGMATGWFTVSNLSVGFVLGFAILYLCQGIVEPSPYFVKVFLVIRFVIRYLWDMVLATLRVAYDVLIPGAWPGQPTRISPQGAMPVALTEAFPDSVRAPLTAGSFVCPGVIAIPLDARTDVEITMLANLITLTPGSVSLDLSEDKRTLYVHAMYIDGGDVEAYRRSVKEGLERRVLELLR